MSFRRSPKKPRNHNKNLQRVISGMMDSDETVETTRLVSLKQFEREQLNVQHRDPRSKIWERADPHSFPVYYRQLRELQSEQKRLHKICFQLMLENERINIENARLGSLNNVLEYESKISSGASEDDAEIDLCFCSFGKSCSNEDHRDGYFEQDGSYWPV